MHEVVGSIPTFSTLFAAIITQAVLEAAPLFGGSFHYNTCIEGYLEKKEPQGPQYYKATDNSSRDTVRASISHNLVRKLACG